MIQKKTETLYTKLCQAREMLKRQYREPNKIALINYMENMSDALYMMGEELIDEIDIYEGVEDAYHLYCRNMKDNYDLFVDKILEYKKYHQELFGRILPIFYKHLPKKNPYTVEESHLSREDFIDILYSFFQEIHLEDRFERLLKEERIYTINNNYHSMGFFIYNPINQDSDIFIEDFRYDLSHMNTLVHEIGHYYDFTKEFQSIDDFNQYFYMSCNREVISLLMERLFYKYLLKNHIKEEETKNLIYEFQKLNLDLLETAYMYCFVDKDKIDKKINKNEIDTILNRIDYHSIDKSQFISFLKNINDYSFTDTYQYVYGDIFSLVLAEEVEKNGFMNTMMDEYFRQRHKPFSTDYMIENGINADTCIKIYQKELKLIQK